MIRAKLVNGSSRKKLLFENVAQCIVASLIINNICIVYFSETCFNKKRIRYVFILVCNNLMIKLEFGFPFFKEQNSIRISIKIVKIILIWQMVYFQKFSIRFLDFTQKIFSFIVILFALNNTVYIPHKVLLHSMSNPHFHQYHKLQMISVQ